MRKSSFRYSIIRIYSLAGWDGRELQRRIHSRIARAACLLFALILHRWWPERLRRDLRNEPDLCDSDIRARYFDLTNREPAVSTNFIILASSTLEIIDLKLT